MHDDQMVPCVDVLHLFLSPFEVIAPEALSESQVSAYPVHQINFWLLAVPSVEAESNYNNGRAHVNDIYVKMFLIERLKNGDSLVEHV